MHPFCTVRDRAHTTRCIAVLTNRIASIVAKSPENYLFATEISYKEQAAALFFPLKCLSIQKLVWESRNQKIE